MQAGSCPHSGGRESLSRPALLLPAHPTAPALPARLDTALRALGGTTEGTRLGYLSILKTITPNVQLM